MKTFTYDELLQNTIETFKKHGIIEDHAVLASEAICSATLRGVDSHGVRLIPHYLEAIKSGRIDKNASFDFKKTGASTGILDANHGIGHAAVATAMDHAIELARESGSGFVTVKNSNHCGAMAYYGLRAAEKDMIGLAFTNATAKVKVFNAKEPFFGINPICITAPMEGEEPFCYDAAPTVMSNNKIKLYKERGEEIPEGIAADENGVMTTNPAKAKMLLPLGGEMAGYKGYAMAMVVDILCSLLSGMPNGKDVTTMYEADGGNINSKRYLGQFVGAIDISRFTDLKRFKERIKKTAESIRILESICDDKVMIPNDPEKNAASFKLKNGILIEDSLYKIIYGL